MASKYGNKKKIVDGIKFDSMREARRYEELKALEEAGEIENLQLQVKFELIPSQYEYYKRYSEKTGKRLKDGKRSIEQPISYIADFVYRQSGEVIVEDVKGCKKGGAYSVFSLKRKLMLFIHNIKIREVK